MNKFKLFALAVCAMLSTNVFADGSTTGSDAGTGTPSTTKEATYVVKDGLIYEVKSEATPASGTTPAKPATVELAGIAKNTKGNQIKTAKAVTVPSTITVTIDDEDKAYNVVSIADGWESAVITKPEGQDLSKVIETLSIDITNFGNVLEDADIDDFEKLAKLTIVDETTKAADAKTKALPIIPKTVASLDIEKTWITALYKNAFMNSKVLKEIVLPAALETINEGAFQNCAVLEGIIAIPATVKTIGIAAFEGATKADIDLSKAAALETIADRAFQKSGITAANLNASVKLVSIGDNAFNGCEKLAKLQMSGLSKGKLEKIGIKAFYGTAITAANIPATVKTIRVAAFANCKSLTQVSAMAGLEAIPNYMFQDCEKLAAVSINEAATSIGDGAFEGCKKLAKVTIKTNEKTGKSALTKLGVRAFKGCEALTSIDLSATEITTINGNDNAQFIGCKALKEIKVPATLTTIGAQAFGDCLIEDLDLSETKIKELTAIFRYSKDTYPTAKEPYASLKSIKLPEVLETILDYSTAANAGVFQYCTGLTEITIPEKVTSIPSLAFQYCTALKKVTMSDGNVAAKAFWYCDKLETFNYLDTDITDKYAVDDKAFLGCTPFINFVTTGTYQKVHPTAPTNTKYGTSANAKMKTVAEATGGSKAYGYFWNQEGVDVVVPKADDLKLFSVYVDEGTAYFQALRTYGGKYIIASDDKVIIKTDAPKEIEYTTQPASSPKRSSVLVDEIVALKADQALADFQSTLKAGEYVYRLTNNASTGGFGFTFFTGTTMKAGQFFIISTKKPAGAARLQTVWLDEDGNVEGDATGIQQVDAAQAQDGAIYNLQGVRVNAVKKGLYIQNGKKFIVK